MDAVESAYRIYGSGAFHMPPRIHVDYRRTTLLYMSCFIDDASGTKVLTVFPENRGKDHPTIDGIMLLNDYDSGTPRPSSMGRRAQRSAPTQSAGWQ